MQPPCQKFDFNIIKLLTIVKTNKINKIRVINKNWPNAYVKLMLIKMKELRACYPCQCN